MRGEGRGIVNFFIFHFPFSIFHSNTMENEKWKMKNVKI